MVEAAVGALWPAKVGKVPPCTPIVAGDGLSDAAVAPPWPAKAAKAGKVAPCTLIAAGDRMSDLPLRRRG